MEYKQTEVGVVPETWDIKPLAGLLSAVVDNRGKTAPTSNAGIPLIATNCIKEHGLYPVKEKVRFINEETYATWFRSHPLPNDIILVNKGTPGQVCLVPDPVDFCIAQDMVAIRPDKKEIDWKFLFAYLRSDSFKKQVQGLNVGTTIPHLKKTVFSQVAIPVPPRKDQEVIGQIYYDLSNKIELNLRMSVTLEGIVRAIFKQWFIDFQFPGFNGEFVDDLPKGWRIGKVKELCKVNANILSPEDELEVIDYVEISEVSRGIVDKTSRFERGSEPSRARRKLSHGDVVLSTVRPDRGAYFLALHPGNNLIASTGFAVFSSTSVPFSFLFVWLTNRAQLRYYGAAADGGAYPAINPSVIMNMDIIIPPKEILDLFHISGEKLFERIEANLKEIKILTKLRERLLPKLMSGKLHILQ
jgi:type I restriction enzyme, S subunit